MNRQYNIGDKVFHNWTLTRMIGEGVFSYVFEAEREDFGRVYKAAVKIISLPKSQSEIEGLMDTGIDKDSIAKLFKDNIEEFTKSLSLMSSFKGFSNIVSYEDHIIKQQENSIGWDMIIRMELLSSADEFFKNKKPNINDVKKLGVDICHALELFQRRNILHNGVKLKNIYINEFNSYKLGGFDTICAFKDKDDSMPMVGVKVKAAPEVLRGDSYSFSADLYSLGMIMYKLLNNDRMPFLPASPKPFTHIDKKASYFRILSGEELPAPENATKELAAIILKACAFDPKDRYADPMQMALELKLCGLEEFDVVIYASPKHDSDVVLPVEPFKKTPFDDLDDYERTVYFSPMFDIETRK